jgi:hypothetical protein
MTPSASSSWAGRNAAVRTNVSGAMKSLPYWIQRADFSVTDHGPADVAAAIQAFDAHPWPVELHLESELQTEGRDYCPPGIGFVDPDGPILHVCPGADGRALVHFHPKPTGGGWFRRAAPSVHTRHGVPRSEVVELIHSFFHGQHDWIVQKLSA